MLQQELIFPTIDGSFNVTAGDDFFNNATINADSFNVTAGDDFFNLFINQSMLRQLVLS